MKSDNLLINEFNLRELGARPARTGWLDVALWVWARSTVHRTSRLRPLLGVSFDRLIITISNADHYTIMEYNGSSWLHYRWRNWQTNTVLGNTLNGISLGNVNRLCNITLESFKVMKYSSFKSLPMIFCITVAELRMSDQINF